MRSFGICHVVVCGLVLCSVSGVLSAADVRVTTETTSRVVPPPQVAGEDWPRFLGLSETGVSGEKDLLKSWPATGPALLWKADVGTGYSAPSIRGNRLVVHHRLRDEEIIECRQADTGTVLWRSRYPSSFSDPYGYNNGPRCSPVLTDTHCFTFGAEGKLVCTAINTGELVWVRDVQADFKLPDWFFGIGCTPILEGDLLIVLVGGQPNSGVVAFDSKTGKTVWEAVGKQTWDGAATGWTSNPKYEWSGTEMVVSYSSPIVATIHGKRHLLCLVRQGLVSLDPQTGKEYFHYWFMSRTHDSVNAARPLVIDDQILLTAAYRVGSVLLKVADDHRSVSEVWRDEENLLCHWSTPIYAEGKVYGFSGRHEQEGELRCLNLADGKVDWKTNGLTVDPKTIIQDPTSGKLLDKETRKEIPWPLFGRGSKIQYEDKFIILGERGTLALAHVDATGYREISRTSFPEIGYPAWAAPVLSRKKLYLRDENALLCLDLNPSK